MNIKLNMVEKQFLNEVLEELRQYLIILSIVVISLFTYSTGSPWHTINVFAPDIALLTIIMGILMALNGLLAVYVSFRSL